MNPATPPLGYAAARREGAVRRRGVMGSFVPLHRNFAVAANFLRRGAFNVSDMSLVRQRSDTHDEGLPGEPGRPLTTNDSDAEGADQGLQLAGHAGQFLGRPLRVAHAL